MLWMYQVSFIWQTFLKGFSFLVTPANTLTTIQIICSSCGMSLHQSIVVSIVMVSSTRRALSLRQYSMKMSAGLLRLQSVESFQVFPSEDIYNRKHFSVDKASAAIEIEFTYKHCCDDGSGKFVFSRHIFEKFLGLDKLNSTKLEPSTCSRRTCYFANSPPYSSWVSSKVQ